MGELTHHAGDSTRVGNPSHVERLGLDQSHCPRRGICCMCRDQPGMRRVDLAIRQRRRRRSKGVIRERTSGVHRGLGLARTHPGAVPKPRGGTQRGVEDMAAAGVDLTHHLEAEPLQPGRQRPRCLQLAGQLVMAEVAELTGLNCLHERIDRLAGGVNRHRNGRARHHRTHVRSLLEVTDKVTASRTSVESRKPLAGNKF